MSSYYISTRKKIRGWKRRIRQLDKWGEHIMQPDLEGFHNRGYTFERCTVYPFYMSNRSHLPMWFYKSSIRKLVSAYDTWKQLFVKMGVYYDLVLWLHDPAYAPVEIICYRIKQQGELTRFRDEAEQQKPFPFKQFSSPHYDLQRFDWLLVNDIDLEPADALLQADYTAEDLIADGYVRTANGDGEEHYEKLLGDLWIGRIR